MITLEVQKQCFVGFKGERFRFFLSDEGYRNVKHSEQEGEIKIKSHAALSPGSSILTKSLDSRNGKNGRKTESRKISL